ncbi:MAG: PspC domain-containing protein [Syntrophales bacterium]
MSDKSWLQGLTKSQKDKWICGVCGGLGEDSPAPSWCWRIIFVLLFVL